MATTPRSIHAGAGTVVGTTGLATGIVWALGYFHVSLSAEVGSALAGGLSAVSVFVWHVGIRNILRHVWIGEAAEGAATAPTP